jgi:DNA mismatch repair protein MutS
VRLEEAALQDFRREAQVGLQISVPASAAHGGFSEPSPVETALNDLDLDGMSPREAMDALYRLRALLAP